MIQDGCKKRPLAKNLLEKGLRIRSQVALKTRSRDVISDLQIFKACVKELHLWTATFEIKGKSLSVRSSSRTYPRVPDEAHSVAAIQ